MIRLTIPEPAPSWNQFYAGKHWSVRKKMADRWHKAIAAELHARDDNGQPIPNPVHIDVTVNHPDKIRRDPDNICAKLLIDGLVAAGVLADDSDKQVASVTTRITRDKARPRETVLTLEAA